MIAWLDGVLREKTPTCVVVDVNGVGYELFVPLSTFLALPDEGKTVSLRVHTHVREDAIQLFGFLTARERALFELLLRANGIGPRLAQSVLSGVEPEQVIDALADGDLATLRRVPGLGQKKAERLVVELRDRAADLRLAFSGNAKAPRRFAPTPGAPALDGAGAEAVSALLNLGYAKTQAESVIDGALGELGASADVEGLLRAALRRLSK